MATPRKPTLPTTDAIDAFCAKFDDLFNRRAARQAFRHYLIGLLLPRERTKTMTVLASLVPGCVRQRLHHFLHDAPWDAQTLNARRLQLWRDHPTLRPHGRGVLIVDETGDRKRGHGIPFAAQQYIGKVGFTANGVVSVTSHWTDGTRHVPLGVKPYWPASRLPEGKKDPQFRTKPELAWELIEEAWRTGIPFRAVVADCVYGEHPTLTTNLFCADIPYVVAIRSNHGVWQFVEDEANPPAFNPKEAAERVPLGRWQRVVRRDSHGKELVHYVAELELGNAYGPRRSFRLIAATTDPTKLKKDATWYLVTNLPLQEASPREVYETYCLRDWVEHYYKPAKHELGWADFQTRDPEAIVRHWQLVMLAFTFSLLQEAPPAGWVRDQGAGKPVGEKTVTVELASGSLTELGPARFEVGQVGGPVQVEAMHLHLALLGGPQDSPFLLPACCRDTA
jgi:SRSO17 transposase